MVTDAAQLNAETLERELDWLARAIETRVNLYFGHETPFGSIYEIEPPDLEADNSPYARIVRAHEMGFAERLVLLLGLVPHVRPQLLDLFLTQNAANGRPFTEFGGKNGQAHGCFVPTGETAMFILADGDLSRRFQLQALFEAGHFFAEENMLRLERSHETEPALAGAIAVSREVIDAVTAGEPREPMFGHDFPARRIETPMEWDDLVLDPACMEQVLEIKAWADYGEIFLHELGMWKKVKPGCRAIFYGPPGTGKTLTAALLGKATGHRVFKIDLPMVVSKYIGDTEKHLDTVFNRAERRKWILFFDEADALFGKRTDIHEAHDRYANQEVSFLLQRVEDFSGVVILASNRRSNLDDAFTRRFHSVIHFALPKPGERLRLWRNSFSGKYPPASDVDLARLAELHEFSGGAISNIARYATLASLSRGEKAVAIEDIMAGIRKELQKEGRTA